MKKIIFCFLFSSQVLASSVWQLGLTPIALETIENKGFVSKDCLKECALKKLINTNISKLKGLTPRGGQDPASLFCKEIGAQVVYMSLDDLEETFCKLDEDIMSLSLLLP